MDFQEALPRRCRAARISPAWAVTSLITSFGLALLLAVLPARATQIQPARRLAGHVPAAAVAGAQRLGPIDDDAPMSLALVLHPRDPAGLSDLLGRLYDPADPLYGHYLSADEFTSRFGPSPDDYALVAAFVEARRLAVTGTHPNRLILDVSGSASAVESALGVEIDDYADPTGRVFHAPASDPALPDAIASRLAAVVGLDDATLWHPYLQQRALEDAPPAQAYQIGTGPGNTLTPINIRTAYNLNGVTADGTGQTLALFELDGYKASDITAYETYFGLAAVPLQNVLIDGFSGAPGCGASEVTMDIQMQVAVAPGTSKILVYEGPNSGPGVVDTYNRIATDNKAAAVSSSWGRAENLSPTSILNAENAIFQQMAAQGQSIFVASGDSGAYADGSTLGADDPASQPYVCGVGGTRLSVNAGGTFNRETTWNGGSAQAGAGGGGISQFWPQPQWQQGAITSAAKGSTTRRNVPDVALNADPNTGYAFYMGGWGAAGGTSCAAPLWSAFIARVNQQRLAIGAAVLGFPNPAFYQIGAGASYSADFHDVADGSTNLGYPAVAGYDDATGLGSFNGANLLADLAASSLPPMAPTGLAAAAGDGQITLSWTASPGASSYNVKRATASGGPYTTLSAVGSSPYTDTGVTNGTAYYYVVSATNGSGESANSAEVSATPRIPPPLPAPAHLSATAGNAQVSLSWTASTGATGYYLKRAAASGGPYTTITSLSATSYADTGVTNNAAYYYVVSATSAAGESDNSGEASATPEPPAPAAPTNLSAVAGDARVALQWTAPAGAITYKVRRSTAARGPFGVIGTSATPSYTDTGLSNGTTFYYVVSAINTGGESPTCAAASATPQLPPPGAPTNLTATAGNAQVSLAWSAVTGATGYVVKRSTNSAGPFAAVGSPATPGHVDATARNNVTYYYVVAAANARGSGPNSSAVSTTPQPPVPAAPVSVTATAGNARAVLTWAASAGAATYNVKRSSASGGPFATVASVRTLSYTNTGLTNDTTYYYVFSAVNTGGESPDSAPASAKPEPPAPATPTRLIASIGNAFVQLKWGASASAALYNVKRSTAAGGPFSTVASPTTPAYTDTDVVNGTTYYYAVSAANTGGESPDSAPISATPLLPAPPASLTATAGNVQVKLAWAASVGATGYNVKRATTAGGPYVTLAAVKTTAYTNTGLTNNQTYYYVVTATIAGGESDNAAEVAATPQPPPPAAPRNLAATPGDTQASLRWTASATAASYNIKRSAVSGGPFTTVGTSATPGYTDTGLTDGTAYYYVASAVNTGGESANSVQISVTPRAPAPSAGGSVQVKRGQVVPVGGKGAWRSRTGRIRTGSRSAAGWKPGEDME